MENTPCSRCGKVEGPLYSSHPWHEHYFFNSGYEWFHDIEVDLCEKCVRVLYNAICKALTPTHKMLKAVK